MTYDGQHPPALRTGSAGGVRDALRRATTGAGRRTLLVTTLLVGTVTAVLVVGAEPVDSVALPVAAAQLLMSVLVPLSGVLMVHDLTRGHDRRVAPVVVAAVLLASAVSLVGSALCAVVVVLAPQSALGDPGTAVPLVLGGVAVQVTAQLVGTGLGLLVDRALAASAATIALPLGLWLFLEALGPPAWLQQWLTPFAATAPLLSGAPTVLDVAVWAVVLVVWGGGLNGLGAGRLARRRSALR